MIYNVNEFKINGVHTPEIDRQHAIENYEYMKNNHAEEIKRSIENSKIYDSDDVQKENGHIIYRIDGIKGLDNIDTVGAIYKYHKDGERLAVLNFADYLTPGGCYMTGADFAQEEALCHESDLYNVLEAFTVPFYLENRKDVNDHVYYDKAIYSEDILFNRDGNEVYADVITCAAPYAYMPKHSDWSTLRWAIADRLDFIVSLAIMKNVDTLILGAFGCGAFGNDPYDVSRVFRRLMHTSNKIKNLIVAIPGDRNYEIFKKNIKEV